MATHVLLSLGLQICSFTSMNYTVMLSSAGPCSYLMPPVAATENTSCNDSDCGVAANRSYHQSLFCEITDGAHSCQGLQGCIQGVLVLVWASLVQVQVVGGTASDGFDDVGLNLFCVRKKDGIKCIVATWIPRNNRECIEQPLAPLLLLNNCTANARPSDS